MTSKRLFGKYAYFPLTLTIQEGTKEQGNDFHSLVITLKFSFQKSSLFEKMWYKFNTQTPIWNSSIVRASELDSELKTIQVSSFTVFFLSWNFRVQVYIELRMVPVTDSFCKLHFTISMNFPHILHLQHHNYNSRVM